MVVKKIVKGGTISKKIRGGIRDDRNRIYTHTIPEPSQQIISFNPDIIITNKKLRHSPPRAHTPPKINPVKSYKPPKSSHKSR